MSEEKKVKHLNDLPRCDTEPHSGYERTRWEREAFTKEEREAWDRYFAAAIGTNGSFGAAVLADKMLEERRKRWG